MPLQLLPLFSRRSHQALHTGNLFVGCGSLGGVGAGRQLLTRDEKRAQNGADHCWAVRAHDEKHGGCHEEEQQLAETLYCAGLGRSFKALGCLQFVSNGCL